MSRMADWRMQEPPIFGVIREWLMSPTGMYVGTILGENGGVYTVNSDHLKNAHDAPRMVPGIRVRFIPTTNGSGADAQTRAPIPYGLARDVSIA